MTQETPKSELAKAIELEEAKAEAKAPKAVAQKAKKADAPDLPLFGTSLDTYVQYAGGKK